MRALLNSQNWYGEKHAALFWFYTQLKVDRKVQDNYLIILISKPISSSCPLRSAVLSVGIIILSAGAFLYSKGHEGQLCIWTNMHCCINLQPLCCWFCLSWLPWIRNSPEMSAEMTRCCYYCCCCWNLRHSTSSSVFLARLKMTEPHSTFGVSISFLVRISGLGFRWSDSSTLTGELPRGWPRSKIGYKKTFINGKAIEKNMVLGYPPFGNLQNPQWIWHMSQVSTAFPVWAFTRCRRNINWCSRCDTAESEGWKNCDI